MKAGRELDALVAEKVMGCKVNWTPQSEMSEPYRAAYPLGMPRCDCNDAYNNGVVGPHDFTEGGCCDSNNELKKYSTDMAAAWEVVEKLKSTLTGGCCGWVEISAGDGDMYSVVFVRAKLNAREGDGEQITNAKTAPLAISLAALKAVGVTVE